MIIANITAKIHASIIVKTVVNITVKIHASIIAKVIANIINKIKCERDSFVKLSLNI